MSKSISLTGYPSVDKPWERELSFFKRHPIIPNTSIYSLLKLLSIGRMSQDAVECESLRITYEKMFKDAETIARALKYMGVKIGDIVTICMPNLYQAIIVFLASNSIGAITTFLNPGMSTEEINDYIKKYDSPVLFNFMKSEDENRTTMEGTALKYVVTLQTDNQFELDLSISYDLSSPLLDFHSLGMIAKKCAKKISKRVFNANEEALILYTSGSTGFP